MNEKTLLELKYEDERKERERRKITNKKQKEKENKSSQIKFSKQEELKEKIIIKEIKFSEIPKIVFDDIKINFKHVGLEKNLLIQREKLNLKLPHIELTKPSCKFLNSCVDKNFNIAKAENSFLIPKFGIIPLNYRFLKTEIDKDFYSAKDKNCLFIPNIEILESEIKYPQNKLNREYQLLKLNKDIKMFEIPKISIPTSPITISNFKGIEMSKNLEIKGIAKIKEEDKEYAITEEIKIANTSIPNENETNETEIEMSKDPMEFLFGSNIEGMKRGGPLIVLFKDYKDDSYIQTFETLLLRICREKYGGIPKVKKLSLKEDWNKYEIERYLDEGNIFIVELDSKEEINKDNLSDRLWAIFSKERGIVIFYTKSENIFEKYKTILNEINWTKLNLKAKIIEIIPKRLSFKEKINVAKALFGFIDIEKDVPPIAPMDAVLNFAKEKYKEKLEKINNKYYINLGIINEGENESEEHMNLKSFVAHYLIKKLEKEGKIPKEDKEKDWDYIKENIIITEHSKEGKNNNLIVDVYFDDKNENYEIETLFKEGFGKIHKTLEKYNPNEKINIVIENITAFLHAKEFLNLINLIEKKQRYKNLEINFYTLDLKNNKLTDLKYYYKKNKN
ncbi:Competence CoiA family protein [Methanocaldococcus vulcanius M7]|uniref:Competence CoiA family protein n=1 Tax=Methanocaldococcus vulcanius (strain ATCC 700851 / DSM 12094 / M7) TaxID=579137 RepID=C9RF68_METVM|nr:hypothetical protein [Methanocaldococcus vulcanius]ACX72220.1 Competence CoiA family protein [Methanocaldococcus vulcanius M7]